MEKIKDSEFIYKINCITNIQGENGIFYITFDIRETKEKYELTFDNVYDLRYSTENANVFRFGDFEARESVTSDIVIVENSKYIEYYKSTLIAELEGTNHITHYIITDFMDTVVDVLNSGKPTIKKL